MYYNAILSHADTVVSEKLRKLRLVRWKSRASFLSEILQSKLKCLLIEDLWKQGKCLDCYRITSSLNRLFLYDSTLDDTSGRKRVSEVLYGLRILVFLFAGLQAFLQLSKKTDVVHSDANNAKQTEKQKSGDKR